MLVLDCFAVFSFGLPAFTDLSYGSEGGKLTEARTRDTSSELFRFSHSFSAEKSSLVVGSVLLSCLISGEREDF
jgi:hypothetical protein